MVTKMAVMSFSRARCIPLSAMRASSVTGGAASWPSPLRSARRVVAARSGGGTAALASASVPARTVAESATPRRTR